MDSISPEAGCVAGNHSDADSARTLLGKLMEQFGLGNAGFTTFTRPTRTSPYRQPSRTSSRQAP